MTRALVTGASGFIGARLAEHLVVDEGMAVRVALRRFRGAAQVARLPVEIAPIGGGEIDALRQATAGCQYVFHCAHDWADPDANLRLAERLLNACAESGVKSLVYLSSLAAYAPFHDKVVTEESAWLDTSWPYALNKRRVTALLLGAGERAGIEVTVLEPPCVYGPFSTSFAIVPVAQLRAGRVAVAPDDAATCNLLYIDDLVRAMSAAAASPATAGKRFLLNGPETTSWRDFYCRLAAEIGTGTVITLERTEVERMIAAASSPGEALRRAWHDPHWIFSSAALAPLRKHARRLVGQRAWQRSKRTIRSRLVLPGDDIDFRWAPMAASSQKAASMFGFAPSVGLDKGIAATGAFVRWARL